MLINKTLRIYITINVAIHTYFPYLLKPNTALLQKIILESIRKDNNYENKCNLFKIEHYSLRLISVNIQYSIHLKNCSTTSPISGVWNLQNNVCLWRKPKIQTEVPCPRKTIVKWISKKPQECLLYLLVSGLLIYFFDKNSLLTRTEMDPHLE